MPDPTPPQASIAQFWLPSLFRLDETKHGTLQPPPRGQTDDTSKWTFLKFLFSDFGEIAGVTDRQLIDFLTDYLDRLNPALTALLMAGYAVPSIEFGFPRYTLTSGGVDEDQNPGNHILRIDLRTRQVSVERRDGVDPGPEMFVRPVIQRLSDTTNVPSIALGPAELEAFNTGYIAQNAEAGALRARSAAHMLNDAFEEEDGSGRFMFVARPDSDLTVRQQRQHVLEAFCAGVGAAEGVTLDFGVAYSQMAVSGHARTSGPVIRDAVLIGGLHAVFDAILWFVGKRLMSETVAAVEAGTRLPGMLWAFDPGEWDALHYAVRGRVQAETYLPTLRARYGDVHDMLRMPDLVTLAEPQAPDNHDRYWRKVYGMVDAMGYSSHLDLCREPGLRYSGPDVYPAERVIDLMLGAQIDFDRRRVRKSNRKKPEGSAENKDKFVKVNASVEGVLSDMAISLGTMPWFATSSGSTLEGRVAVKTLADNFVFNYSILVTNYSVRPRNNETFQKMIADSGVFVTLMGLFNHEILSIASQTGDLSDTLVPDIIMTLEGTENAPVIRLRHSLFSSRGITLRMAHPAPGGLPLVRCFAWELIPGNRFRETADMQTISRIAAAPAPAERLVIVAAPGVEISPRDEGWPSAVPLDIYRVQSHALVPDPEEAINLHMLKASYPIGILDDLDPSVHDYRTIPALAWDALWGVEGLKTSLDQFEDIAADQPECLPFVTVTPLQKQVRGVHYSGVQISTRMTSNLGYRGVHGSFTVEILTVDTSGEDRFAFDIRYALRTVPRVTRRETQLIEFHSNSYDPKDRIYFGSDRRYVDVPITEYVDIAQFEVVVHRTPGVVVNIIDSHAGPLDWAANVIAEVPEWLLGTDLDVVLQGWNSEPTVSGLYRVYDTEYGNVPVNGVPLETPMRDSDAAALGLTLNEWDELRVSGDTVFDVVTTVIDTSIGFIPIVGDVADVAEFMLSFATGTDRWGRPITNFDRALMFGGMCLPFVGSSALRAIKGEVGEVILDSTIDVTAELADDIPPHRFMDWVLVEGEDL